MGSMRVDRTSAVWVDKQQYAKSVMSVKAVIAGVIPVRILPKVRVSNTTQIS